VVAHVTVSAGEVFHAVSRRYHHVILLACVSAVDDALTSMIISQAPVRDSLWIRSFRRDEEAIVHQRNPAFIDEQLFYEYLSGVFIPYLANLRSHDICSQEIAICLMDSASMHVSERCLRLLGDNRILAVAISDRMILCSLAYW
jgi:hypothetical protein